MSAEIECPICLNSITGKTDIVTTKCGHCYHASCLMLHVDQNGFNCPYCRRNMVFNNNEAEILNPTILRRPFERLYDTDEEDDYVFDEEAVEIELPREEIAAPVSDEPSISNSEYIEDEDVKRVHYIRIDGKKFLHNRKNNDIYDFDELVNNDNEILLGKWDPLLNRIIGLNN